MQIKKIIKKSLNLLTLFEILLITLSPSPLSADFNVFPQIILEENTKSRQNYLPAFYFVPKTLPHTDFG